MFAKKKSILAVNIDKSIANVSLSLQRSKLPSPQHNKELHETMMLTSRSTGSAGEFNVHQQKLNHDI